MACRCGDPACDLPTPTPEWRCPSCGKVWYSQAVAEDCCGDWLGYD